jgi:regulator of protease activity HflC (stomatin/prohibitin superfamily)
MFLLASNAGATVGIVFGVLFGLAIIAFLSGLKVVRQSTSIVVERLGKYHKTLETGVHLLIPFIDRGSKAISLKEMVADFKPQSVITKDNVTMQIDTVVYFQVTDAKLFVYGIENPLSAIENLTATTLRNIVGELELDETLTSRDTVNVKMRQILDQATDPWGIKVNRVELKNILPPKDIQEAMEKQMRAERERREQILRAEGEKTANILVAEGEKRAKILRAEADKESKILIAEGERASLISEAEGKAREVELITAANPSKEYIALASYQALVKVANGNATKIIIPSEMQNMASVANSLVESIKK